MARAELVVTLCVFYAALNGLHTPPSGSSMALCVLHPAPESVRLDFIAWHVPFKLLLRLATHKLVWPNG